MYKNSYFLTIQLFLLFNISELTASVHSHTIDDLDEYESLHFVSQYFSNTHSTFNDQQGFEVINLYYGASRYSLQQAIHPIRFYGFANTNFMADRYIDMQNIHAFFFKESYTLLSNFLSFNDEMREINPDEYWAALIFYRFLKPRTLYHATPLHNIDQATTWLCNNTAEEQVLRLFNTTSSNTDGSDSASVSEEIQALLSSDALTAPALIQSVFLGITPLTENTDADEISPRRVEDSEDDTIEYLEQQLNPNGFGDDPESPQS